MNKRLLFLLAASTFLNACSDSTSSVECNEDQKEYNGKCYNINDCVPGCDENTQRCVQGECIDKNTCIPECNSDYQKCYEGKCIGKYQCAPSCDEETEKCYRGTCYDINVCMPECDSTTQKCADGKCVDINECYPACQENEECVEGTCHDKGSDPDACYDKQCKDKTTYCDDTGHWSECEAGYGCHMGYCLKGLAPECEDGECSEDGRSACQNGTFVTCGSLESCSEGKCVVSSELCEAGSCSEDGNYRCTDEGQYVACPVGMACVDGTCESNIDPVDAMLWQTCTANSDCARGICLFEVSTSRPLSNASRGINNADVIPISTIEPRIPEGTGVCSQDCTRDPAICDNISTSKQQFTCQVVMLGDSPYPPRTESGHELTLPFADALSVKDKETSPFASICRPNDSAEKVYKKSFCQVCSNSSECDSSESCINGQCLPQCSSTEMCPLNFTCASVDGMESLFCLPNAVTCSECLDMDNDGQGYGKCEMSGFDCDDTRSDVYYNRVLPPSSCSETATDLNCNGQIDYAEMIGSADNCEACGTTCKVAESASNIARQCTHNNEFTLDDTSLASILDTYIYQCNNICDEGYADCDNDLSNGCETQLITVDGDNVTVTDAAEAYSLDADKDGHGVMNNKAVHYCCKSNNDVCYAMPNTLTNDKNYWNVSNIDANKTFSSVIDDCNDENQNIYAGHPEVCDGLDNDCDASTVDGSDSYVKLDNYQYLETTSSDSNKLALNDTCTVYEASKHTVCTEHGTIQCKASGDTYSMVCFSGSDSAILDNDCDGIDDDCDGLVDEDYVFTNCKNVDDSGTALNGICQYGVQVCENAQEICKPLFTQRAFDFYGDGVDSDCDGYDWDNDKAVFVANYDEYNIDGGNDNHSGRSNSPVASLSTAFDKAKMNVVDGEIVHDIFVNKNVKIQNDVTNAKWGRERVDIPKSDNRYSITLKNSYEVPGDTTLNENSSLDQIIKAHIAAYQKKVSGDSSYSSYNPNDYLFPKEEWPRKEHVAIYGGFLGSGENWSAPKDASTRSTYEYIVNKDATHTFYDDNNTLTGEIYEMITCHGGTMSLKLDHMDFSMSIDDGYYSKKAGTTFYGLNCSNITGGCSELNLKDTDISVTAPKGIAGDSVDPIDDKWGISNRNGADGLWLRFKDTMSSTGNYKSNYSNNVCFSNLVSGSGRTASWGVYTTLESSFYNFSCPDFSIPRGGCGGVYCCDDCTEDGKSYVTNNSFGKSGLGANCGKKPTTIPSLYRDGCDDLKIETGVFSESGHKDITNMVPIGQRAGNGSGGAAGTTSNLSQKFVAKNTTTGCNAHYIAVVNNNNEVTLAGMDGSYGISGGGGAGGHIKACWDKNGTVDYWGTAGSGGAGGCCGYGGKAGGTGGSAVGLELRPTTGSLDLSAKPDDVEEGVYVDNYTSEHGHYPYKPLTVLFNNVNITANASVGGNGSDGQSGIAGGKGGRGIRGGDENSFGTDRHCFISNAGGAGGAGGGGGGGAAGFAGQAYGILFVCPSDYNVKATDFNNTGHLTNCGMYLSDEFLKSPSNYIKVVGAKNGTDGTAGTSGSWQSENNAADSVSKAGSAGKGGSSGGGKDNEAKLFEFSPIGLK